MGEFDPYYLWLGIPPKDQPPNHYRLLGVDLYESNIDVIARAADRQMAYLRSLGATEHLEETQRLLGEITNASRTLLDPAARQAYDTELQAVEPAAGEEAIENEPDVAMFGEYLLLDQIDRGGTGQTFKAQHRTLGRVVALKILSENAAASDELVGRFRRKARILAALSHPNLVPAFDAGVKDGVYYLITEHIDGDDLVTLLRRYNPLPVGHVVGYISQAAAGLGYAHAHGVYHRNVKPSNIMVDGDAVVKVIGLGLARVDEGAVPEMTGKNLTQAGRPIGSFDYMSPEQALSADVVDHRTDIYALGCTMFALLTGRPLFVAKSNSEKVKAHRHQPAPTLSHFRSDVPVELDGIIHRMVAKKPADRFQSMNDVIAALQPF
jgi:serine/threonine protein kinase